MTMQATPVILAQHYRPEVLESTASDLQRVIARVLATLSQRRWQFVLPVLTGLWLSLAVGLFVPRRYYVTALFEREDDVVISKLISDGSPYSFETLRRSLVTDLKGYNAVASAVETLGLLRDFPHDAKGELSAEGQAMKQALVTKLVGQINVNLREKSEFLDLVEITYLGTEPELGVKVLNQLKDSYMAAAASRVDELVTSAYGFFGKEMEKARQRVAELEDWLLREGIEHPGVRPSNPDLIDQQLSRAELALEGLERDRSKALAEIEAREAYLRELSGQSAENSPVRANQGQAAMPYGVRNPRRTKLAQDIENLRAQINDKRTMRQMTDHHPEMEVLLRQLESVQREYNSCPEWVPSMTALSPNAEAGAGPWEGDRKRTEMEIRSLRESVAQMEERIKQHQADKTYLEKEKSELFERRQNYMLRQQELEHAKNELALWKGHVDKINRIMTAKAENRGIKFATVEPARQPSKPFSPTLSGVLMLSASLATGLGVLVVFLREILDRTLRSPARVRAVLGIPVLEAIGEITAGQTSPWLNQRRVLQAVALAQIVLVLGMGLLTYLSIEKPQAYEAIARSLRAGLF